MGDNYLTLSDDEKRFIQNMVFHEYLETIEKIYYNDPDSEVTLLGMIAYDLKDSERNEEYERCQLYRDVLKNIGERIDNLK